MTIDDLPWTGADSPATRNGAKGRRCTRHKWATVTLPDDRGTTHSSTLAERCVCGAVRDPAASRRGTNNRSRGLRIQRIANDRAGLENLQGNGPKDGTAARFVSSVKSGPSWYSVRVERELDALPVKADQIAIFIAGSTPGSGKKRRIYVQLSLADLLAIVGPEAQVAVAIDDWGRLG